MTKHHAIAALAAIASTSLLVWFGNGLNPLWPLLWFAPLPVLLFALRGSCWSTALVAGLSWLIGSFNLWHYLRVLGAPPTAFAAIFSVAALMFAAAVLLFRALVRRGAFWSALLAFPATWVSFEYVRNLTTPHGTAGSLAYSQLAFLPFLQLASVTGPWGMSFLLLLFPAAFAIALHLRHREPKRAWRILSAALGVIALVLILGTARLVPPQTDKQVAVGLVASDAPANLGVAPEGPKTERLFRDYAREAEKLAARGAQVIVLPEKLGVVLAPNGQITDAIFQSVADKTRSTIVVGLIYVYRQSKYNQARVYAPGKAIVSYNKHHMLPPVESNLEPGTTLTLMSKPSGVTGIAICKDMDFTPLLRRYGRAGAGLMLVPGWDFDLDRGWHGHIAIMRGVEDGFNLVRAAREGYLTVSDTRGRILAETQSDSAPFATLVTKVPKGHHRTVYLLMGDWFAWFSLAMLLFALIQLLWWRGDSSLPSRHSCRD